MLLTINLSTANHPQDGNARIQGSCYQFSSH